MHGHAALPDGWMRGLARRPQPFAEAPGPGAMGGQAGFETKDEEA